MKLHKYLNVLQLPIVDIAAVLYVACKNLFALLLNSLFSDIFIFALLANDNINWITDFTVKGVFQQKSFINLFKLI